MVTQAEQQAERKMKRQLERNGYKLHVNRDMMFRYEVQPVAAEGLGNSVYFQSLSALQAWADNLERESGAQDK